MDDGSDDSEGRSFEGVDLEQGIATGEQYYDNIDPHEFDSLDGDYLQHETTDDHDAPEMATLVENLPWPPETPRNGKSPSSRRHETTTTCAICLDSITDRAELELCQHSYCRGCLMEHCKVSWRQYPIACPHQQCEKPIPTRQVQELLPTSFFDAHLKHYWLVQSKDTYHECPVCSVLLTGGGDTDFICANCENVSCRVHGRTHAGISCRAFQATDGARSWDDTEQILSQWTKPCSHCGISLQKAAGCDHIVCVSCQQDMCWKEYLTGTVIRHCAKCNRDYRDHRHDRSYRLRLCLIFPILIPFILLYMAIAAALCIVTGCFVCCFQCGQCLQPAIQVEGNEARRVKFGWTHGVGATLFLLLLPVIALMEDCGFHVAIIDVLFPELSGEETEIPAMQSSTDADQEVAT